MENKDALTGGDDAALFNEMTAGAAAEPAPDPAAPVVDTKPAQPIAETTSQPVQEREQPRVPLNELIEERRARQGLEKQLQALIGTMQANQPAPQQKPAPDIWDDPRAYLHAEISPMLQQQQSALMYNAKLIAESRFGEDAVKEAEAEFNRLAAEGKLHPSDHAKINGSPNPFAEAVKWHQSQRALSEIGTDPAAYRQKLRSELLNDPEFRKEMMATLQQQAGASSQGRSSPPIALPSLSKVGAAAIPSGDEGVPSDVELWNSATSQRRR